ncbi:hypothetical protein EMCRGX_G018702 [Ephydatia muelleri]
MNTGQVILTFTETLNQSTINITQFTFQLVQNSIISVPMLARSRWGYNYTVQVNQTNEVLNYTLTGGAVGGGQQAFVFTLSSVDLNRFKRLGLCSEAQRQQSCYVTLTNASAWDMVGLPIVPIGGLAAQQARYFTPDRNPPSMNNFVSIDMNYDTITLVFNETFNISSFDPTAIRIQKWSYNNYPVDGYFGPIILTGGFNFLQLNDTTLQFTLTAYDMNRIKQQGQILCYQTREACYIRFNTTLVKDMAGNPIVPLVDSAVSTPLDYVNQIVLDTKGPILLSFMLDMDKALMDLTFNETVLAKNFDGRKITFYNSAVNETASYSQRIQVGVFYPDVTPPVLTAFKLDLTNKLIILIANEPITLPSVVVTGITLLSSNTSNPFSNHTLLNGTVSYCSPEITYLRTCVQIRFSPSDQLSIQLNPNLSKLPFLSIANGTFADVFNNKVLGIPWNGAFPLTMLLTDTMGPQVTSFTIDMNTGLMEMTFDDIVDSSTFNPTGSQGLTLQGEPNSATTFAYTLTGGTKTASPSGFTIEVNLSIADLNAIKARPGIATSINNTYITAGVSTIQDLQYLGLIISSGLQASQFTSDKTPPYLSSSTIDMNSGQLLLTFDETVNAPLLKLIDLFIGSASNYSLPYVVVYGLTGGSSTLNYSTSITVTLSVSDLNALKCFAPNLVTSGTNSFLAFNRSTITDMNANPVIEVSETNAIMMTLIPDKNYPSIVSYNLNLTAGTIILTFNDSTR